MSQAPVVPVPHDPYAPLRLLNFRWFVASILAMAMGAQIQGVVVAWQMYAITHDPLALGMVGLAEAAPFIAFAQLGRPLEALLQWVEHHGAQ